MFTPSDISPDEELDYTEDTLFFGSELWLSREQVGRALILGISPDFAREMGERRKKWLTICTILRKITPDIRQKICGIRMWTEYRVRDITPYDYSLAQLAIESIIPDLRADGFYDKNMSFAGLYAESITEAREFQTILFFLTISRDFNLPLGILPNMDKYQSGERHFNISNYLAIIGETLTIPQGILHNDYVYFPLKWKPEEELVRIVTMSKKRSSLSDECANKKVDDYPFSALGTFPFAREEYDIWVQWMEEVVMLGGWFMEESPFPPKFLKPIFDRFFIKHAESIENTETMIWVIFKWISHNYKPNQSIKSQVIEAGIEKNRENRISAQKKNKPSVQKLKAGIPTRIEQLISHPRLIISDVSRWWCRIEGYPDGEVIYLLVKEGGYSYEYTLPIVSGCIDLSTIPFSERLTYTVDFSIPADMTNYTIRNPSFELKSPILEYAKSTVPVLQQKIENTVIRTRQTTSAKSLVHEWKYPDHIILWIREVGNTESPWWEYSKEDTISFGEFMPGEYEICFLYKEYPLSEGKRLSLGRLPTFRVRIEVVRTVEIVPRQITPPEKRGEENREWNIQTSSDESLVLNLALLLEGYSWEKEGWISVKRSTDYEAIYTFSLLLDGYSFEFQVDHGSWDFMGQYAHILRENSELIRSDIERIIRLYDKSIETERILERLRPTISYVQRVSDPLVDEISSDAMVKFSDVLEKLSPKERWYYGAMMLQPWWKNNRELLQKNLHTHGVSILFEYPSEPGKIPTKNHIKISLSLEGESPFSGHIISTNIHPYHEVYLDEVYLPHIWDSIVGILQNLLLICGSIGYIFAQSWSKWQKQKITKNQKLPVSTDMIGEILSHPGRFAIERLWLRYSHIEEIRLRFEKNEWKICRSSWYDQVNGYPKHIIRTKQWKELLRNNEETLPSLIVVRDERIASLPEWRKGNPYIYDLIHQNTRLQKYLITRIIATIQQTSYEKKSPFTGTMEAHFTLFWSSISPEKQWEFRKIAKTSKSTALTFDIKDGKNIISALLVSWQRAGVQMVYNRPQTMSIEDFHEARKQLTPEREKSMI